MEEDNARYQAVIRKLERAGVEVDVFGAIACNDVGRVATILRDDAKIGERRNSGGRTALQRAVNVAGWMTNPSSFEPYLVDSFSRDKMNLVGISTESESRSQEVVARSGFGLYGLGWLWHLAVSIPKETR
jgi:hypothetical protein